MILLGHAVMLRCLVGNLSKAFLILINKLHWGQESLSLSVNLLAYRFSDITIVRRTDTESVQQIVKLDIRVLSLHHCRIL